jgi:hypothetical protein
VKRWVLLVIVVLGGWAFHEHRAARRAGTVVIEQPGTTRRPAYAAAPAAEAPSGFSCDGRTHCSQMTSCAEANYFLQHCPGVQMDGDRDGRPCERQWCD